MLSTLLSLMDRQSSHPRKPCVSLERLGPLHFSGTLDRLFCPVPLPPNFVLCFVHPWFESEHKEGAKEGREGSPWSLNSVGCSDLWSLRGVGKTLQLIWNCKGMPACFHSFFLREWIWTYSFSFLGRYFTCQRIPTLQYSFWGVLLLFSESR